MPYSLKYKDRRQAECVKVGSIWNMNGSMWNQIVVYTELNLLVCPLRGKYQSLFFISVNLNLEGETVRFSVILVGLFFFNFGTMALATHPTSKLL